MSARRTFDTALAVIFIWTTGFGISLSASTDTAKPSKKVTSKATDANRSGNVTIKADSYGYSQNVLKAEGDVTVIDGDMELHADIMTVRTTRVNDKLTYEQVVASGKTKPVRLKSADGTASGQMIDYNVIKGIAELSGKAEITFTGGGQLAGAEKIILDRTKQVIRTVGGHPRALIPHVDKASTKAPDKASSTADKGNKAPTEITSDEITYDMGKGVIEFKGRVHVIDDEMDLKGDSLKVFRNKDGKASRITIAGGDELVRISNAQGSATGPRADYDLISGILQLHGKANLTTTNGIVFKDAENVLYYRDKKEFEAKGGSIDISNKSGGSLKDMFNPSVNKKDKEPLKPADTGYSKESSQPLGK